MRATLKDRICDVPIASHNWREKHWNSISNNYAKANCFKSHSEMIKSWYFEQDFSLLSALNEHFLMKIHDFLQIKTPIIRENGENLPEDRNERLVEICQKLGATSYLSGPAAQDYLDVKMFEGKGIAVEWMEYHGYPEYPQRFPPFAHGVSVLDLILNMGDSAPNLMLGEKI